MLAQSFIEKRNAFLIFDPEIDVLRLFTEAQALIPKPQRWQSTFTTWFTRFPPNVKCRWRGVVAGSAEANQAKQRRTDLVIDLTGKNDSQKLFGTYVDFARTGVKPKSTNQPAARTNRSGYPVAASSPSQVTQHSGGNDGQPNETDFYQALSDRDGVDGADQFADQNRSSLSQQQTTSKKRVSTSLVVSGVLLLLIASGLGYIFGRNFNRSDSNSVSRNGTNDSMPSAESRKVKANNIPEDDTSQDETGNADSVTESPDDSIDGQDTEPGIGQPSDSSTHANEGAEVKTAANTGESSDEKSDEPANPEIVNAQPAEGIFQRREQIGLFAHDDSQNVSPPFRLGRWDGDAQGIPNLVVSGTNLVAAPNRDYSAWVLNYNDSRVADVYFNESRTAIVFRWSQDESLWDSGKITADDVFATLTNSSWKICKDHFLMRDVELVDQGLGCKLDPAVISDLGTLVSERLILRVQPSDPNHRALNLRHREQSWVIVDRSGEDLYVFEFNSEYDSSNQSLNLSVQLDGIKHGALIRDLKERMPGITDPDYFRELKQAIIDIEFAGQVLLERDGVEFQIARIGQLFDKHSETQQVRVRPLKR